jgi:phage gpG-like protein
MVNGVQQTAAGLSQALTLLKEELSPALRESLLLVTRTAQKVYLSGPRPERLGVRTGRLRSSLEERSSDNIFAISEQGAQLSGTVGTSVEYAEIHERGGIIRPKRSQYLAVPTSLAQTASGVTKSQYDRPLRQIPNLFIRRSKSGVLYAAERTAATGHQRRSSFRVLFWLVRSVRIPARPFLSTALRDSTQAITQRFTGAAQRVEQRLQAFIRGR